MLVCLKNENVAFTVNTCDNYDIFKNQINMKIQYLKPYSMLCFYFTPSKNAFKILLRSIYIYFKIHYIEVKYLQTKHILFHVAISEK